ncbi:MAG: hypothetical protein K2X28_07460 [Alphaproteobacteria bacterium]|nr:hypothetical protein [Alphaproteobacteria bacterium]
MRHFFTIIFCCFSFSEVNAMCSNDETIEARKLNVQISSKGYEDFIKIKKSYYGEVALTKLAPSQQKVAHFYEIIKPDQTKFYVLGTSHDLPLEVLPEPVLSHIKEAANIYVESEAVTLLASFQISGQRLSGFTRDEEGAINKHLSPLLALFHPELEATALHLKDLYSIFLIYDCLLGMDSEVIVSSLSLGKSVWMLDALTDFYTLSLALHRQMLKDEAKEWEDCESIDSSEQSNISHKISLLGTDTEQFLRESIKENIADIENCYEIQENLESSMKDYAAFNVDDTSEIEEDPDSKHIKVQERNDRWNTILENAILESVICIGHGHLPDLFTRWRKKGYVINRTS